MFGSRERLYNAWVRDHYRFLFRSAWALTGSRAVAEEVVQDCFELAWRNMSQLRERKLARAWLYQILRREALRSVPRAGEIYVEEHDPRAGPDAFGDVERRLDILAALQKLPPIHREALTLFYFDDMPVSEMAIALEVAPGTVLSRLNRARVALREILQADAQPAQEPVARPGEDVVEVVPLQRAAARGARD